MRARVVDRVDLTLSEDDCDGHAVDDGLARLTVGEVART